MFNESGRHLSMKDLGKTAAALVFAVGLPHVAFASTETQTQVAIPTETSAVRPGIDTPALPVTIDGTVYTPSRVYPQCGGTLNGEIFPPNHLLIVTELSNPIQTKSIYGLEDRGLSTQCSAVQIATIVSTRTYPQLGQTAGLYSFPSTDTIWVTEADFSDGSRQYSNTNLGNLGQSGTPAEFVSTCNGPKTWQEIDFRTPKGPFDHSTSELKAFNEVNCK